MSTVEMPWPVQDAKSRFSELLKACLANGPQTISRRGVPQVVMVPLEQWQQVTAKQPTVKDLLLDNTARFDIELPPRGQGRHRQIEPL